MLLTTYPYVFYILFGLPGESVVDLAFFGLIALIAFVTPKKGVQFPRFLIILFIIQAFGWLMFDYLHNDSTYITRIFFMALAYLAIYMLIKSDNALKFCMAYNSVVAAQALLGAIAFILIFIGILSPYQVLYLDDNRIISNYILTCSNTVYGNFARIGGFFDEPGALASWGMLALLENKILFDNRKIEIALIVGLIFTFSAAYFVLLPIYLVCFYVTNLKSFIPVAIVLSIVVMFGYNKLSDNDAFRYLTVERFENGQIRTKRDIAEENAKQIFYQNPAIGIGAKKIEQLETSQDNPYEILAKDGTIGFIITYLPLFLVICKYRKHKEVLMAGIILILSYMQRPFHINEMHFFMLYFFCALLYLKYENEGQVSIVYDISHK